MQRWLISLVCLSVCALSTAPAGANSEPDKSAAASQPTSTYLEPALKTGQAYTDLFARVQTLRIEGFDEKKGYISGMGTYVVSADSTPKDLKFALSYQYHGTPPDAGPAEIRDGGRTECLKGKCEESRDASGLVYNPSVWGVAPEKMKVRDQWTVNLTEPWELGPAGHQTVTVVAADPIAGMLTLKREGEGDGRLPEDPTQMHITKDGKTFLVNFVPGHSHWLGQTTFKSGIIVSDEIMVYRTVSLSSAELGNVSGIFHEYTLQSLSPQPSDGSNIPI